MGEVGENDITLNLKNFQQEKLDLVKDRKQTKRKIQKLQDKIHNIKIRNLVNNFARKISISSA